MRNRSAKDQSDADAREIDKGQVAQGKDVVKGKDMAWRDRQMHDPVHADPIAPS